MGDASDVENWILPFQRVKPRVVAKWALRAEFAEVYVALEHNFSVGGYLEVHRLAGHQFHCVFAQEPGKHKLIQIRRDGQDASQRRRRVGTYGDGNLQLPRGVACPCASKVLRAMLLRLPVHSRGSFVEHLHAVAAYIALPRFWIFGDDHRPGDVTSSVLWPALQNRKFRQREVILSDHFLAGP